MAVAPGESAAAMEGILAFGVLWLDWSRGHAQERAVEGLRLFVPEGAAVPAPPFHGAFIDAGVEVFDSER